MEKVIRLAPWAIAAVAGFLTLQGLMAQVAIQSDLNAAMLGVLANVREAGQLTGATARAMAPLASTAATLQTMNGRLRATHEDLAAMNGSLGRVLQTQAGMIEQLESLNRRTAGVTGALTTADGQNRALLKATTALSGQTVRQAGAIEQLSELTEDSITNLSAMNRRFAFLR